MSAIPPHVAASVLQSGVAQKTQAADRDNAENTKAYAAREGSRAGGPDDVIEVEATDADTQVHPDSGGLGSQGRHDAPPQEEEDTPKPADQDVTFDEEGKPHLDLSA